MNMIKLNSKFFLLGIVCIVLIGSTYFFVREKENMVGLDASIISHPKTWKASGHIANFSDVAVTCKKCKSITKVDSFVNIVPNSEKALQQALIQQPISIAVVASGSNWQFYSSGIITDCPSTTIDHGVLLTSYGTSDGVDYWGVKNSWGSSWGENGYIRLARNVKQTGGTCGLTSMASYPVINKTEIY